MQAACQQARFQTQIYTMYRHNSVAPVDGPSAEARPWASSKCRLLLAPGLTARPGLQVVRYPTAPLPSFHSWSGVLRDLKDRISWSACTQMEGYLEAACTVAGSASRAAGSWPFCSSWHAGP